MSEKIEVAGITRAERYDEIYPQLKALLAGEDDVIANMANFCAALKDSQGFFWIGFYLVRNDELVLGPFQGPVACTRIGKGRGVCGAAWAAKQTIIVEDVERFPGHIACSSLSKSEIVVPLFNEGGDVVAVLDVDSDRLSDFDEADRLQLEKLVSLIKF